MLLPLAFLPSHGITIGCDLITAHFTPLPSLSSAQLKQEHQWHRLVTGQIGIGQNVTDKLVAISIDFNSIEYIFSNHTLQISDKPKFGLNGSRITGNEVNHICQWELDCLINS